MANGKLYDEGEIQLLATLIAADVSVPEMIRQYRLEYPESRRTDLALARVRSSNSKLAVRVAEIRAANRQVHTEVREHSPGIHIEEPQKPQAMSVEAMWERAKERTDAEREWFTDRHFARITIQTDRPIALAFKSDHHVSEDGPVDLRRMERDALIVRDTPGLFAALGGDGVNNHIKHRSALVNSSSSPGNEYKMYDHYLGMMGRKVLFAISGNHDDWTKDFAGVDAIGGLYHRRRLFYAPDFVVVTIVLQSSDGTEVEYVVKLRHQYRYGSSFNLTHTVKRLWEMGPNDFDVGVVCHHHELALEPFFKQGRKRYAIRPGAYQIGSGHSRRYGFGPNQPSAPTVIFEPFRKRMRALEDVSDTAEYLTFLRERFEPGPNDQDEAA